MILARCLFALSAFLLAAFAGALFWTVITANGATWLHVGQVLLLTVCCLWLGWGFNTAIVGILYRRHRPPLFDANDMIRPRTAVLVPVYNEDADSVLARVAAMIEGLRTMGRLGPFDFHILSDSTRSQSVAAERRAVFDVARDLEAAGHIYYRHRANNHGRKAGNIADFVTRSGGAYDYMLVLDADSLMRPATILEMVARIHADPQIALLQTQPLIIGRRTLFGRGLQFSAALYSPFFSRGIAALQGREGPFWGHNAIIRIKAFADTCGLPDLSGRPPFGGHILSHDFVEAALLAKGGWKVRVDPDLEGSYEEAPANLIEYAKRDRRWCQGNLQHGRLLTAPGLRFWSRVAMVSGIMAYAASPIWLMFLTLSLLDPILAPAPNYFPPDSLFPVFPRPETGRALLLLLGIFLLLLLPKTLIAFRSAFTSRGRQFGGWISVLLGATVELVMTSALAPIMMMFQSRAVMEILSGRDSGWPATDREDEGLAFSAAFASSWWMVLAGAALLLATWSYAMELFLWVCPIGIPLLTAPIFIWATASPAIGDLARRLGVFSTPFELKPEPVIRAAQSWHERLSSAPSRRSAAAPVTAASRESVRGGSAVELTATTAPVA